jgi:hypothetical protein
VQTTTSVRRNHSQSSSLIQFAPLSAIYSRCWLLISWSPPLACRGRICPNNLRNTRSHRHLLFLHFHLLERKSNSSLLFPSFPFPSGTTDSRFNCLVFPFSFLHASRHYGQIYPSPVFCGRIVASQRRVCYPRSNHYQGMQKLYSNFR